MKKFFLLAIICFSVITFTNGQSLGVNNDGSLPDASAMLDIKNPNKGLLMPRVALTGTNDVATIATPAVSLIVYNTATTVGANAVTPGYYFWNGSVWVQFSTSLPAPSVPEVVNFLGGFNSGTAYNVNDLVTTAASPDVYFYSLISGNTNNTPESSPLAWQPASIEQLKIIHKVLTLSAPGFTSLMSTHLTGTFTVGGRIQYTVLATDGGSQIATENGILQYLATANSITCTVQTTDKLHLGTVNSGCTPGFFNPASQPGVSIFDNVTFSSPAPIVRHDVYFRILPASGQFSSLTGVTKTLYRLEP